MESVKNLAPKQTMRSSLPRSRFGYGPSWWGASAQPSVERESSYWAITRAPIPCLVFILPILLTYEIGVILVGGESADRVRTGADAWIRRAIGTLGLTDRWLPALAVVVILLGWQAFRRESWRFRGAYLAGMAFESVLLAFVLVGLGRLIDLGFDRLDGPTILDATARETSNSLAPLIGYLGAGVYEEALFRLGLIPTLYAAARRLLAPELIAATLAVTGSSVLFSLAHHAGMPGESFTWFAFIFRWVAGIFFAWVFLTRGFGIAVGTHAIYDVLVGWAGFHF